MLEVYTMEEVIGRMCCFDSGNMLTFHINIIL
jgi:hypothetical protein